MVQLQSSLLVVSADRRLAEAAASALLADGWSCMREESRQAALDRVAETTPAAILVDGRETDVAAFAMGVRELAVPLNGTPILTAAPHADADGGGVRRIDPALPAEAFRDLLRQWAGPLGDHALRSRPWGFRYRLIRLLGLDAADGMLGRLRDSLRGALDALSAEGQEVGAHRLAGVAGLCGFADLGRLWSKVSHGEDGALAEAVEASLAAVAAIDAALAR